MSIKPELTWAFLATHAAIAVLFGFIGSILGTMTALVIVKCH